MNTIFNVLTAPTESGTRIVASRARSIKKSVFRSLFADDISFLSPAIHSRRVGTQWSVLLMVTVIFFPQVRLYVAVLEQADVLTCTGSKWGKKPIVVWDVRTPDNYPAGQGTPATNLNLSVVQFLTRFRSR